MKKKFTAWLFLGMMATLSAASHAGMVSYSATNVGGVPFTPDETFPSHLQGFVVDGNGTYTMEVIAGDFDTILFLYSGPVDLANLEGQEDTSDDDGGAVPLSLITFDLSAGISYTLLTRGFDGAVGNFTNRISGPGGISLTSSALVPEPGTLALLGLGLLGLGLTRRKTA